MKWIFTFTMLLLSLTGYTQQMTYEEWQQEAEENIRLLPKYGNLPKNENQKAADSILIAESLELDKTSRAASSHMVRLGFTYLNRGDLKTAMYRFNQAWLIDSTNEESYWGFGSIYFSFNDFKQAMAMYDKGLDINPNSSVILTDKATLYLSKLHEHFDKKIFTTAQKLFDQSYKIDTANQNTLFKLSVLHFLNNDCTQAKKYYDECKALGGKPLTEKYTIALEQKCN